MEARTAFLCQSDGSGFAEDAGVAVDFFDWNARNLKGVLWVHFGLWRAYTKWVEDGGPTVGMVKKDTPNHI